MTESQAMHLIQQFADQCPFAIWILDSRGVAVFANDRLHQMLDIKTHPSGALGVNLFNDPSNEFLGLSGVRDRLKAGEAIETTISIDAAEDVPTEVEGGRKGAVALRVIAYPLYSTVQKIEHYVVFLDDVSGVLEQKKELEAQMEDIRLFLRSKDSRADKLRDWLAEEKRLEAEIRQKGAEPAA